MYKVIMDSCGEMTEELKNDKRFCSVPLQLEVGGEFIADDENFNQAEFLRKVSVSETEPHSACPSPEQFMNKINDKDEHVHIITLSSGVSGSYNSACLAASIYNDDNDKPINVIDSKSASVGETLIALKIKELEELKLSFSEIKKKVDNYVAELNIYGVLETLDTLRKAGRLKGIKSVAVNMLNIKLIIGATEDGQIKQVGQARGMKKALSQMVSTMLEQTKDCSNKILAIAHCACPERAEYVKSLVEKAATFKDIIIVNTSGVSSMYANAGGILLAV